MSLIDHRAPRLEQNVVTARESSGQWERDNLATAGPFDDLLGELEEAGFDRLVLDLRRLTFIDCSRLRILLMAHTRAGETRTELTVLGGPGQARGRLAPGGVDQLRGMVAHPAELDRPAEIEGVRA